MNQKINVSKFARHIEALSQVNPDYRQPHEDAIEDYLKLLPHGSGIDSGITFHYEESSAKKLMFTIPFHHMDDNGYYCGWRDYNMTIRPCLKEGFDLKITGRDPHDIKDYLYDLMSEIFYFDPMQPIFPPPSRMQHLYLKSLECMMESPEDRPEFYFNKISADKLPANYFDKVSEQDIELAWNTFKYDISPLSQSLISKSIKLADLNLDQYANVIANIEQDPTDSTSYTLILDAYEDHQDLSDAVEVLREEFYNSVEEAKHDIEVMETYFDIEIS